MATILALRALACLRRSTPVTAQEHGAGVAEATAAEQTEVMRFGDDFKQFIGRAKSEMTFVARSDQAVEAAGFKPWPTRRRRPTCAPGSRWYAVNRDRTYRRVRRRPRAARRAARASSTRTTIRCASSSSRKPFRESFDISLLDTTTHGALKNYQWVNRPLALIGRVTRTDGTIVAIDIGHDAGRSGADHRRPRAARGSRLPRAAESRRDPDRGARSDARRSTRDAAMKALKEKYNLTPDDFLSADLQIVPAQMPVDVGLDHQLVGAYGHDDRSNGFAAFRAIVEVRDARQDGDRLRRQQRGGRAPGRPASSPSGSGRCWPRSSPRRSRPTTT